MNKDKIHKETDLARIAVGYFESKGYEVYQEVALRNRTVDMVVVKNKIRTAIECKLQFNITLLHQAFGNKSFFHMSYILVPASFRNTARNFGIKIAKDYGIGMMEMIKGQIREVHTPEVNHTPIDVKLFDEQKTYSEAGTNSGKAWTSFANTKKEVIEYLKKNGDSRLVDIVDNIVHHYASASSARSSIARWAGTKAFPEVLVEKGLVRLLSGAEAAANKSVRKRKRNGRK
jgi:hypothetical protein